MLKYYLIFRYQLPSRNTIKMIIPGKYYMNIKLNLLQKFKGKKVFIVADENDNNNKYFNIMRGTIGSPYEICVIKIYIYMII